MPERESVYQEGASALLFLRSPQKQQACCGEKETPIKIAQEPARIRFMGTFVIAADADEACGVMFGLRAAECMR